MSISEAPTEIKTEFFHPAVEAKGAVTFGAFGVALIIVVILIIVGLDAATLQKFVPASCFKSECSNCIQRFKVRVTLCTVS